MLFRSSAPRNCIVGRDPALTPTMQLRGADGERFARARTLPPRWLREWLPAPTAKPALPRGRPRLCEAAVHAAAGRARSFPTWRTAHQERAHDGRFNNIDDSARSERLSSPALSRNEQSYSQSPAARAAERSARRRDAPLRSCSSRGVTVESARSVPRAAPLNRTARMA